MSGALPANKRTPRSVTDDYQGKIRNEASLIAQSLRKTGYPAPLGDAASGVMLVAEQPVGPRLINALERSLEAISLPECYVTWSSTGLLNQELLAVQPSALVVLGPGAASDLDALRYPAAQSSFAEATVGAWFPWTQSTTGILLPSLAPALEDEKAKKNFWRSFLALRALVTPRL